MSYELFVGTRGVFFKCSHNVTHNSSLVTHPSPEYFLGYLSRMASMAHVPMQKGYYRFPMMLMGEMPASPEAISICAP